MSVLVIALAVSGAALLVAEAHVASYGVLGVLGVAALAAAFVVGLTAAGVGLALTLAVAGVVALALGACVAAAALRVRAVHRRRVLGGSEGLVGKLGVVRNDVDPVGDVSVRGELWRACCSPLVDEDRPLEAGEPVVVERVDGLTVRVRRAEEWEVLP
jgi:membrane-bound serine protease (ClpP class)